MRRRKAGHDDFLTLKNHSIGRATDRKPAVPTHIPFLSAVLGWNGNVSKWQLVQATAQQARSPFNAPAWKEQFMAFMQPFDTLFASLRDDCRNLS